MTSPSDQTPSPIPGRAPSDHPAEEAHHQQGAPPSPAKRSSRPESRPSPVGSDAPNRWLTSSPPGDIDALRSSSSLSHRSLPKRRRGGWLRVVSLALVIALLAVGGVALWQLGLFEFLLLPDDPVAVETVPKVLTLEERILAALAEEGFADLTIAVDGSTATVTGIVTDEESLSAAASTILSMQGVAQLDNRLEIGTAAPSAGVQEALIAALSADEFAYISSEVQDRLAVLEGAVPSEEARSRAAAIALGVEGIDKLDNRVAIDATLPIGPALPAQQLEAAAATALADSGIQTVTTTVNGRRAILDGTVPLEALGSGFFAFVETAEAAVLSVDGIDQVSSRLSLRGDGAILRSELQALLAATPVEFAVGSADLTAESRPVLDRAALIIQSQPGLQVIIAGHTDTAGSNETNQALARQRSGAVLSYLLTRGVPSYRLVAVSYGELFPDQEATDDQNRRIEFEVGP